MKNFKIRRLLSLFLVILMGFVVMPIPKVYAATSPTLNALSNYSVLGGAAVTCTGATTTSGIVGVSPGTSISGFPSPCTAGGGTESNTASAIAAQAETVAVFSALDQTCDQTFGAVDLTATFPSGVGPGVYCSTSSFSLSGNLTLTGSGVHIFKTVSTLITSSSSSISGGNPCDVWWRIGSAATLGSNTSFLGNIVTANVADTTALNSGATLNGRVLAQAAATVTLNANTITGPTCSAASSSSGGSSSSSSSCPALPSSIVAPTILSSRRIDADSIFISWGPFSGVNTFNVQFGTEDGNWLYNTNVTGFSTTINDLPLNQPIWVRVAARSDCTIGMYGASFLVGSTSRTLSPLLPNTGFGSQTENSFWTIVASVSLGFSVFYFIRKVRTFSSK